MPDPEWRIFEPDSIEEQDLLNAITKRERASARSRADTLANPAALQIWNVVRWWAGLESITVDDLPDSPDDPGYGNFPRQPLTQEQRMLNRAQAVMNSRTMTHEAKSREIAALLDCNGYTVHDENLDHG